MTLNSSPLYHAKHSGFSRAHFSFKLTFSTAGGHFLPKERVALSQRPPGAADGSLVKETGTPLADKAGQTPRTRDWTCRGDALPRGGWPGTARRDEAGGNSPATPGGGRKTGVRRGTAAGAGLQRGLPAGAAPVPGELQGSAALTGLQGGQRHRPAAQSNGEPAEGAGRARSSMGQRRLHPGAGRKGGPRRDPALGRRRAGQLQG